jgi:hypothetical protein
MSDNSVYHKTEKGRTEIATRVNKLGLRERAMLIMVDDKTSRADLLLKNTHPSSGGILDMLLEQGFIEVARVAATGTPVPPPTATIVAATPNAVSAPTVSDGGQPGVEVSISSAAKFACKALLTYLGPGADDLTAKIEKCKTVGELTVALEKSRDALQAMAGKKKADDFWAGVSERLPTS